MVQKLGRSRLWHGVGYLGLLLAGGLSFLLVQRAGGAFSTPLDVASLPVQSIDPISGSAPQSHSQPEVMFHILLTMSVVILVGKVFGAACKRIGQPPVIGEVLAGIALGPSLLGLLYPPALEWLIPPSSVDPRGLVASSLKSIAGLGIVLYMFLVGLELDTNKLRHRMGAAVAISHSSIVVPFVLGTALALWLYPTLAPEGVSFLAFSTFSGVAMSITAFPVLARILTDRGLQNTYLGTVAIGCAAADDVTAWCLLAVVIGVVQADVWSSLQVVTLSVAYMALMVCFVRPVLERWIAPLEDDTSRSTASYIGIIAAAILLSASITEAIGIHALFGAFLLGGIIPFGSRIASDLSHRLKDPVLFILLPAFFAYTGLRTEIGLVSSPEHWGMCLLIISVATLGKFGGTLVAAKLAGEGWRESLALGTLMNTRGLMELIVLNIGLELGVISPLFFTIMVIMAIVTTMLTSPVLHWLTPKDGWATR